MIHFEILIRLFFLTLLQYFKDNFEVQNKARFN